MLKWVGVYRPFFYFKNIFFMSVILAGFFQVLCVGFCGGKSIKNTGDCRCFLIQQ